MAKLEDCAKKASSAKEMVFKSSEPDPSKEIESLKDQVNTLRYKLHLAELKSQKLYSRRKLEADFRTVKDLARDQDLVLKYYAEKGLIMEDSPYPDDISEVCRGNLCVQVEGMRAREFRAKNKEILEKYTGG